MPKASSSDFDLQYAFGLPPKDAVAYFRSKGFAVSDNWWEIWQGANAKAFTVAKATRMDVLESIRAALDKSLVDGMTERDFSKQMESELKRLGWWGKQVWVGENGIAREVQLGSQHRLKTIYRVNHQTAYMAGRYRQQMANADARPFWMYVAIADTKTRAEHARLNGKVFRWDDPIWQVIYPPNGWNCRCRIRALTAAQVERMGLSVENGSDYIESYTAEVGVDPRTGEVITQEQQRIRLPNGSTMTPDVGWSHNPGAAAFGTDMAIARKLEKAQSIELRSQLIQALNNSPLRQSQFAAWAGKVLDKKRPANTVQALGFMTPAIQQAVTARLGKEPTSLLAIGEKQLVHADSAKHQDKGVALSRQEYLMLPKMLADPEAVLWDTTNRNLLYIYPSKDDSKIKIVINTGWAMKKQQPLDTVINAYKVDERHLKQKEYEVLEGKVGS